jgi:transcriptional regulator with PAS, ATPase and Fis domain
LLPADRRRERHRQEVLAGAIHKFSDRAAKPFIPFNCTAVPREMLESRLFGYKRGAFTRGPRPPVPRQNRRMAEIGKWDLDLKPKLLRFLESGGSARSASPLRSASTSAPSRDQPERRSAGQGGRFRDHLFYRLNVIPLCIWPVLERRDEIPGLVRQFVTTAAAEFKKGEEIMEHLLLCRWPGSIRQLLDEGRRMVGVQSPTPCVTPGLTRGPRTASW